MQNITAAALKELKVEDMNFALYMRPIWSSLLKNNSLNFLKYETLKYNNFGQTHMLLLGFSYHLWSINLVKDNG